MESNHQFFWRDSLSCQFEKTQRLAREAGLNIDAYVADMRDFQTDQKFDLVISHGCLHLLAKNEQSILVEKIQDLTLTGGFNIVLVFTDKIPSPVDLLPFTKGLFKEGELFQYYSEVYYQ